MFGSKPMPAPGGAEGDKESAQLPAVIKQQQVQAQEPAARELVSEDAARSFADLKRHAVAPGIESYIDAGLETEAFKTARAQLLEHLIEQVDFVALSSQDVAVQRKRISDLCDKLQSVITTPLNGAQLKAIKTQVMDEVFGFGPLEPLLADNDISDIMINGHQQVYIEKKGKIRLTDVTFFSEQHLLSLVQRIVQRVGRRVDEASPMVDARMPDGSRFNAIIPPLALDGCLVSIRKFRRQKMPLQGYVQIGSMTQQMCQFLEIAANIGTNIIISGGTGSGKTTLLNALSGAVDHSERIITIEDAAELQLQQPHVLRLETRPASMEGKGEVTQRQLVKNALRMRPDRIILGEIRGDEVIDVLSAMNTGHDGSMATVHANNPRDCLARIENLVGMSSVQIGAQSLRKQIASAIQLIVQIERMRDGRRRLVAIEEIVGQEGETFTTQTLFSYKSKGLKADGDMDGEFLCHGIRPKLLSRAEYYGKDKEMLECFSVGL